MCQHKILSARFSHNSRVGFVAVDVGSDFFPEVLEHTGRASEVQARKIGVLEDHVSDGGTVGVHEVDDAVGESCLAKDLHDYPRRVDLGVGRLPYRNVAHQGRRRRQVSCNGREVKWGNRENEAFEGAVLHAVPDAGRALGLLGINLGHELHVEAQEVRELARRVNFGLVHRLGLGKHGCRVDCGAVGSAHEVGGAQKDSGTLKPRHRRPRSVGSQSGVYGLLHVLFAAPVVAADDALVVVRRTALAELARTDFFASNKHRNVDLLTEHALVGRQKAGALWGSGSVAVDRLVNGLGDVK